MISKTDELWHDLRVAVACVPIALLCMISVDANAQGSGSRQGGWASVALGYGSASVSCDSCRGPHRGGLDGLLGLGGTLNPHLRVGATWGLWTTGVDSIRDAGITTFTASLYYYPSARTGGWVDVGLGVSDYRVVKGQHNVFPFPTEQSTYAAGTGEGVEVGFGYEFPHTGSIAFAPHIQYAYGIVGQLHNNIGGMTVQMDVH